jgi:hypothetical protein
MKNGTNSGFSPDWISWLNYAGWLVGLFFVFFIFPNQGPRPHPLDFRLMWSTAKAAEQLTLTNIYDRKDNAIMNDFLISYTAKHYPDGGRLSSRTVERMQVTFTPGLITLFAFFSSNDIESDFNKFLLISKIVFGLGFLILAYSLGVSSFLTLLMLWLATFHSWSYRMALYLGNMGPILTGLLMMAIPLLNIKTRWTFIFFGIILGGLVAIKPMFVMSAPLLILSLLASDRKRQIIELFIGLSIAFIGAIVLPLLILGNDVTWLGWLNFVPNAVAESRWFRSGIFLKKFFRYFHLGSLSSTEIKIYGICINLLTAIIWYRLSKGIKLPIHFYGLDASAVVMGALLYLLSATVVHSHYFVQALPASLVILRSEPPLKSFRWVRLVLVVAAIFLIGGHRFFSRWDIVHDPNHSVMTFFGVWVLLAVLIGERVKIKRKIPRLLRV